MEHLLIGDGRYANNIIEFIKYEYAKTSRAKLFKSPVTLQTIQKVVSNNTNVDDKNVSKPLVSEKIQQDIHDVQPMMIDNVSILKDDLPTRKNNKDKTANETQSMETEPAYIEKTDTKEEKMMINTSNDRIETDSSFVKNTTKDIHSESMNSKTQTLQNVDTILKTQNFKRKRIINEKTQDVSQQDKNETLLPPTKRKTVQLTKLAPKKQIKLHEALDSKSKPSKSQIDQELKAERISTRREGTPVSTKTTKNASTTLQNVTSKKRPKTSRSQNIDDVDVEINDNSSENEVEYE